MKTSIEIPDQELKDVLAYTGAKTKREAINLAISDFNKRERLRRLSQQLGSFEQFIDNTELRELRQQ